MVQKPKNYRTHKKMMALALKNIATPHYATITEHSRTINGALALT